MKFLHLSTNLKGGAGIAALRIAAACKNVQGCSHSDIFTPNHLNTRNIDRFKWRLSRVIGYFLRRIFTHRGGFFYDIVRIMGLSFNGNFKFPSANWYFLHWISEFTSLDEIFKSTNIEKSKIIVYMMDMAPLTGGCHYSCGCTNYQLDCGSCPLVVAPIKKYVSKYFDEKRNHLEKTSSILAVPNTYCLGLAQRSPLPWSKVIVLPIPIDEKVFVPRGSRRTDTSVRILFGSSDFSDGARKGGDLLLRALELYDGKVGGSGGLPSIVVSVPSGGQLTASLGRNYRIEEFEPVSGDFALATLYGEHDFFINCARDDLGPMMLSEAAMCGTPILSVMEGAGKDLLRDGITGFHIKNNSPYEIKNVIEAAVNLSFDEYEAMRGATRDAALRFCSLDAFGRKLSDLLLE